jgi:integrase
MKGGREHLVPLTDRVIEVLEAMKQRATSELVFGGERDGRPISGVAMMDALRRASGDDSTLHGLRSSFRDWCGDATSHPREVAEAALAHIVGDETERAYRRGSALDKRCALMAEWAAYCSGV